MDDAPTNLVALRDARQRAEALVAQRYGEDLIDADQLDRRMERIANAQHMTQLELAIVDLVDPGTSPAMVLSGVAASNHAIALRSSVALARPDQIPDERKLTCMFSALEGLGPGPLARRTKLTCVFGSAEFDLRDNEFGPGATVLDVQLLCGSLELQVPKGMPVLIEASLVLAGVERHGIIPSGPRTPDEPHLLITGNLFMAAIELEERLPGETKREARRRRRRERKLAKAEQKALSRGRG
ncbi:hypothetical protein ACNOYE_35290 [Nannocystaceae bacterium ST9]